MSKNLFFKLSALLISAELAFSPSLYAATEGEQQLSPQERSEAHRKRKPEIAKSKGIEASLKALRRNGALKRASRQSSNRPNRLLNSGLSARSSTTTTIDLAADEVVIDIKHILLCETEDHCKTAHEWVSNNDFNSAGVLTSKGHGGEKMYHLLLRQAVSPDADTITKESSKVHEAAMGLAGIRYATWMIDRDPDGELDNRGNQQ